MFAATYADEPYVRSKLPTCDDMYNLFHPADLIAKRIEPLLKYYDYPEWKNHGKEASQMQRGVSHVDLDNEDD